MTQVKIGNVYRAEYGNDARNQLGTLGREAVFCPGDSPGRNSQIWIDMPYTALVYKVGTTEHDRHRWTHITFLHVELETVYCVFFLESRYGIQHAPPDWKLVAA